MLVALYSGTGDEVLAKIAVALERALARRAVDGAPGRTEGRILARGDGWTVEDVICTSGPRDRPFGERHSKISIAIVAAGSFQYRAAASRELMTPGALLLGNAGQGFECGHEHGAGDRCLSFKYAPDYFESLAADAGGRGARAAFRAPRLPPLRDVSPLIARAFAGLCGAADVSWEELSVQLAVRTLRLAGGHPTSPGVAAPAAVARVTRIVRTIERHPDAGLTLGSLARAAGLSPYHFLRTFERLTGTTPHQYVLRSRLREAAIRLLTEPARILDIAFDCGFGDVSNFNRAFRAEFGVNPRAYRLQPGARPAPACSPL
ncbi:MAG: helix-turn-helix transcriptional regulator [Acidobacteria bacterium]|nr:helix-turn-helix transcriptional regulator [Acidobacteriota bacterium]